MENQSGTPPTRSPYQGESNKREKGEAWFASHKGAGQYVTEEKTIKKPYANEENGGGEN